MFGVYSNGKRLGEHSQRTSAEEMGKHWLTTSESATGYTTVGIIDNPGVVVSIITDDANGPQIHRLDGWEPPKECAHSIDGTSITLAGNATNRVSFMCRYAGCSYVGVAELSAVSWRAP